MSARTMPAIVLTLALAAACEDNPVAPADRPPPAPAEGLTEAESVALFRGIARLSFDADNPIHPGSLVIQCPLGGELELIETIEEFQADGGDQEMSVAFTTIPNRCSLTIEGYRFSVDGNPSLRTNVVAETVVLGFREYVNVTGTITGDFKWQLWQRSGTCPIAGTLDGWASVVRDPDDAPGTVHFTGSVCAHEVKIDMSEWMPPLPT